VFGPSEQQRNDPLSGIGTHCSWMIIKSCSFARSFLNACEAFSACNYPYSLYCSTRILFNNLSRIPARTYFCISFSPQNYRHGIYEGSRAVEARHIIYSALRDYRRAGSLICTDHVQFFHDLTMLYILNTLIICSPIHSLWPSLNGTGMLTKAASASNN
jgi:hypothetical protein